MNVKSLFVLINSVVSPCEITKREKEKTKEKAGKVMTVTITTVLLLLYGPSPCFFFNYLTCTLGIFFNYVTFVLLVKHLWEAVSLRRVPTVGASSTPAVFRGCRRFWETKCETKLFFSFYFDVGFLFSHTLHSTYIKKYLHLFLYAFLLLHFDIYHIKIMVFKNICDESHHWDCP